MFIPPVDTVWLSHSIVKHLFFIVHTWLTSVSDHVPLLSWRTKDICVVRGGISFHVFITNSWDHVRKSSTARITPTWSLFSFPVFFLIYFHSSPFSFFSSFLSVLLTYFFAIHLFSSLPFVPFSSLFVCFFISFLTFCPIFVSFLFCSFLFFWNNLVP